MRLFVAFVALVLPFQLLGAAAYFILARSNPYHAHLAGALIPPLTFFAVFLALFLWRYYHPGMLMLAEGAVNLVILVVMLVGTSVHLAGGAISYYILYRRR